MSSSRALFVGRVLRPNSRAQVSVRIWTQGGAPTPDDRVEEIDDPFLASSPHAGAPDWGDPYRLAHETPARPGGLSGPLRDFELAPPVRPGKVLCIGRNYRAHAEELGNEVPTTPLLFTKPPSALIASGASIVLPPEDYRIDYEGEIVAVIGRRARNISSDEAFDHIAGYTLGNDVSCRDLQRSDKQWTRAKGFDTFAPCGPFVRMCPPGQALDPSVRVCTFLRDEPVQDGPVSRMIFGLPTLLEHISACMSLEPGDLLYTGTPAGVGQLSAGDVVRVEAAGLDLGRLTNPVVTS